MEKMAYRLGLDVGTNSLGWSVLKLGQNGDPCGVDAAGARIFSDGRNVKSKTTLAADRREARSARRRRDRFKQRQAFLLDELTKAGLFPEETDGRKALQTLHPLELRAKALKEKLPPHHIGRALFHLNQRRGFQSNRKDRSEETTSGKVSKSVRMLLEQMRLIDSPIDSERYKTLSKEDKKAARQQEAENRKNALSLLKDKPMLTYGSFLWERYRQGEQTRARPGAGDDGKLYDVYPQRELYEDEFNKIWAAQAKYHSQIMSDATRKRIHHVIFTQRPLKPQKRGKCAYLPKEDRTFRAMPSFQRYRMYQEVNSLEWMTSHGSRKLIDDRKARDLIIRLLETPVVKNGHVVFRKMKEILKQPDVVEENFTFNFETPKRKGLDGNLTSNLMRGEDRVGQQWDQWSLEKQDDFIAVIFEQVPDEKRKGEMREQTDEEVCARLMQDFGLSEFAARNCLEAPLQDGTASVSLAAARLLMDKMKNDPMIQSDAVQKVANENPDFVNPFTRARKGELLDNLPYYGEAFQDGRHIIPGDRNPDDKHDDRKFYGGVTNPTVHIALNQIRQVVNELIRRFGHPTSIAVELGRELPVGKEGRSEIDKEQKANQDRNEKLDEKLRKQGQDTNRDNRLRLLLWENLDNDPNGRCCPFSGDKIGIADLFNGNTEIEHLIPFSRSLDDSRANKIICTRKANRDKGNCTPFEAFGHNPHGYNWAEIFERANKLPKATQWRFKEGAMEIWSKEHDFTERHLNDTRYIGRLTREYLECICPTDNIDVLTGRMTSLLRGHWGLNSILQQKADDGQKKKNRNDHRHHAVDAIVIGMTSRSMLQNMSTAANRAEKLKLTRLFEKADNGKSPIDPWDGFREDVADVVRDITVSHKARWKKPRYETYVKDENGNIRKNEKGHPIRTSTEKRDEAILDKKGRPKKITTDGQLLKATAYIGPAFKKEKLEECDFSEAIKVKGKTKKLTVIPISDKSGKPYKGYESDGNWGMEIYQYPDKYPGNPKEGAEDWKLKCGNWEGVCIAKFAANQPEFDPDSTQDRRLCPGAKFIMRLQINDLIDIGTKDKPEIMRVKETTGQNLILVPHNEANDDGRNRNKNVTGSYNGHAFSGKLQGKQNAKVIAVKLSTGVTGTYQGQEFAGKVEKAKGKKKKQVVFKLDGDDQKLDFDAPGLNWQYDDETSRTLANASNAWQSVTDKDKDEFQIDAKTVGLEWRLDDDFSVTQKSVGTLQGLKARKVHISPTGLVNYEKRRKPRRKN